MPCAHGEPGDAALELTVAAVHVHLDLDALADAQVGQLRLLEVGVDPDFGERADGHQALARLDVVAGVDVSSSDDAVDLGAHVAVAEVELRLIEVALGLHHLGFGLLNGRRGLNDLGIDAIEIALALGIEIEEFLDDLIGQCIERLRVHAERRSALQQVRQRLPNAGKGLVEVGRRLGQALGGRGHFVGVEWRRRQAQAGTNLVGGLQGLPHLCLGDQVILLSKIEFLLRGSSLGLHELQVAIVFIQGVFSHGQGFLESVNIALQLVDLPVHVLHRVEQLETIAARLSDHAVHLRLRHPQFRLGRRQVGFLDPDLNLVRLLVELNDQVSLLDAIVVIHQHLDDLAGDARGDKRDVAVHVGVVRRDRGEGEDHEGDPEVTDRHERNEAEACEKDLLSR